MWGRDSQATKFGEVMESRLIRVRSTEALVKGRRFRVNQNRCLRPLLLGFQCILELKHQLVAYDESGQNRVLSVKCDPSIVQELLKLLQRTVDLLYDYYNCN